MQLDDNKAVFDFALAQTIKAFDKSNYLETSAWAGIAGQCANSSHAGFYVHEQLEDILLKIGKSLGHKTIKSEIKVTFSHRSNLKILHVFTVALPIGGHTRLVERWIGNRSDHSESHSVLLLDQNFIRFPEWLKAAAEKSGGSCVSLPDNLSIIDRALTLRKIAYESADRVVLHTHPNDPTPLIAFALDGGPPIILLNHSDHLFWFGSSIADLVADLRPMAQELTLKKRNVSNSRLLPVPLLSKIKLDKRACRKDLNLPDDIFILLAIASSYKFKPYEDSDFPAIVSRFVKNHHNTILIVIGPSPDETNWKNAIDATDGRVQVLGIVENIDKYYGAADVYLESFPVGSVTSTLDAMLHELPVIQAPAPLFPLLHVDTYIGMQGNAPDIDHYYDSILHCLKDYDFRLSLGKTQRLVVESIHTGKGWQEYIDAIMDHLPLEHKVNLLNINNLVIDSTNIDLADLQSKSIHCDKSHLFNLIVAIRAHSKNINKLVILVKLFHTLAIFSYSTNKIFIIEFFKTLCSIILPVNIYDKYRRAHLEKVWSK